MSIEEPIDALFVSPHLDDAVFSVGGTIARLRGEGRRVVVATVFTRSVPHPVGFALACQTDKGLAPSADYMAMRRDEDCAACNRLGVGACDVIHLDLPEAPHRGYHSAAELFAGIHEADRATTGDIERVLEPLIQRAATIYLPLGHGHHVDHLLVIDAVDRLAAPSRQRRWHDVPYVARLPGHVLREGDATDIAATLHAKIDACACYATQIPFQFGDEEKMAAQLERLARAGSETGEAVERCVAGGSTP